MNSLSHTHCKKLKSKANLLLVAMLALLWVLPENARAMPAVGGPKVVVRERVDRALKRGQLQRLNPANWRLKKRISAAKGSLARRAGTATLLGALGLSLVVNPLAASAKPAPLPGQANRSVQELVLKELGTMRVARPQREVVKIRTADLPRGVVRLLPDRPGSEVVLPVKARSTATREGGTVETIFSLGPLGIIKVRAGITHIPRGQDVTLKLRRLEGGKVQVVMHELTSGGVRHDVDVLLGARTHAGRHVQASKEVTTSHVADPAHPGAALTKVKHTEQRVVRSTHRQTSLGAVNLLHAISRSTERHGTLTATGGGTVTYSRARLDDGLSALVSNLWRGKQKLSRELVSVKLPGQAGASDYLHLRYTVRKDRVTSKKDVQRFVNLARLLGARTADGKAPAIRSMGKTDRVVDVYISDAGLRRLSRSTPAQLQDAFTRATATLSGGHPGSDPALGRELRTLQSLVKSLRDAGSARERARVFAGASEKLGLNFWRELGMIATVAGPEHVVVNKLQIKGKGGRSLTFAHEGALTDPQQLIDATLGARP